jgi:hypothetical protein
MAFDVAPQIEAPTTAAERPADAVTVHVNTDEAEWRALMAAAPVGHLPQDFSFAAGKDASDWRRNFGPRA